MKVTLDFHKSSEERPEKSCEVIGMNLYKNVAPLLVATDCSKKYDAFNADDREGGDKHRIDCDYWAYLPAGLHKEEEEER